MNFIDEHPGAIPVSLCNEIIDRFEKDPDKVVGLTGNALGVYNTENSYKICKEIPLSLSPSWYDIDVKLVEIVTEIHKKLTAKYEGYRTITISSDDGYIIKKYKKKEGIYKNHLDCASIETSNRYLTLIMYLNTVEKGGETYFPEFGIEIKPEAGKICTFPASWTHVHGSKMPISDDKYIIATWMVLQ